MTSSHETLSNHRSPHPDPRHRDGSPAGSAWPHGAARDEAGRALYEQRAEKLSGLAQSSAPAWDALDEAVRERWRRHADASPLEARRRTAPAPGPAFELTDTTIRHDWEQVEYALGGEATRLSLSARVNGTVRGALHRSGAFQLPLELDGWALTGPRELPGAWSQRTRRAVDQLHRRVSGQPHASPDLVGRWDVSVRHLLRLTGAPAIPGRMEPRWTFTPTEMYVDVSTNGTGWVLLFGAGPVESDSRRFGFSVGIGGLVVFDQPDLEDQVPDWAQGPALDAARQAFDLHTQADQYRRDEVTGVGA